MTNRKKPQLYTGNALSRWPMAMRQWLIYATFYKLNSKLKGHNMICKTLTNPSKICLEMKSSLLKTLEKKCRCSAPAAATRASSGKVPDHRDGAAPVLTPTEIWDATNGTKWHKVAQMAQMAPVSLDVPVPAGSEGSAPGWYRQLVETMGCASWWSCILCPPVIKHGVLENGPFISDFPHKTSSQFGDFPLPCLITKG